MEAGKIRLRRQISACGEVGMVYLFVMQDDWYDRFAIVCVSTYSEYGPHRKAFMLHNYDYILMA